MMTDDCSNCYSFPAGNETVNLLYAVRTFVTKDDSYYVDCDYKLPTRYAKYQAWNYSFCVNGRVNAATEGFRGLPRILKICLDSRTPRLSGVVLEFLSGLECLEIQVSTKRKMKVALDIIKKASKLEILSLEYHARSNICWTELLAKTTLSNLHTLVLRNFVMFQDTLHQFLQWFLSIACDHPQKLKLEQVTVKYSSGDIVHKFGHQQTAVSL